MKIEKTLIYNSALANAVSECKSDVEDEAKIPFEAKKEDVMYRNKFMCSNTLRKEKSLLNVKYV